MENASKDLESYSSFDHRIKKIKEYIEDIRSDLDDLKHKEFDNDNPAMKKEDLKQENYNSDAYSFQEEGNNKYKEDNIPLPGDQVFNSINTQELIQNMNSSLNKYPAEENNNVTTTNLLVSGNSYNLNFNYNNNYEKKIKEDESKEMKIIDNPYSYKLDDDTRRFPNENYPLRNSHEYELNLPKQSEDFSKAYDKLSKDRGSYDVGPKSNIDNKMPLYSPYSENRKDAENVYNYNENKLNPSPKEEVELIYSDQDVRDRLYSPSGTSKYPEFSPSSKPEPVVAKPQTQELLLNYKEYKEKNLLEERIPKNNTYSYLNYEYSKPTAKEPSSDTFSYRRKAENNSYLAKHEPLGKDNNDVLEKYSTKPINLPPQNFPIEHNHRKNLSGTFEKNESNFSGHINNDLKRDVSPQTKPDHERLKLNYDYAVHHHQTKNNELIMSLEALEKSLERDRSRSPHSHRVAQLNDQNYVMLENRSSELEKQIADLHIMINELQKNNTMLQMEVVQLNQRNYYKTNNQSYYERNSPQNENSQRVQTNPKPQQTQQSEDTVLLGEIQKMFGGIKKDELIIKLQEHQKEQIRMRKLEELANKIQELYNSLYDIKDNPKVRPKVLWRWIKNVIRHIGKDKTFDVNQQTNKEICENLICHYKLKDINALKLFVIELTKSKEEQVREDSSKPSGTKPKDNKKKN